MRPLTDSLRAGAGAALLCACGCFGPMYNPNGPWGAPGYSQYSYPMNGYPGTIQTQTPGPQYIPGGSVTPGSNIEPTPTYGNGGNAPPFGGGGASPNVPNPADPGNPYFPGSGEQFNQPRSGASATPSDAAPPVSGISAEIDEERLSAAGGVPALGPALRPAAMSRPGQSVPKESPYGHDAAGYAWVEGVVSYDQADQTWNIVYNLDPGAGDEYAGHFTLADSPLARTFREGERVRLEGRVDPLAKDRFGKPTYLAERVIRTAA